MFKYKNSNKKPNKKLIKVLIMTGEKIDGQDNLLLAYKTKDKDGKIVYKGFPYDIWKNIKTKLSSKYEFEETFSSTKKRMNYLDIIKNIASEKYDIVIGLFGKTVERENLVNFTTPVIRASWGVLTKKENFFEKNKIIIFNIIFIISILIFFGILAGIIFYIISPKRNFLQQKNNKHFFVNIKNIFFFTISAAFGEISNLVKKSHFTFRELFIIFIMTIVFFCIIQFLQGEITASLINKKPLINRTNIASLKLLGGTGWAATKYIKHLGASVTETDLPIPKMINKYLNNTNKYAGMVFNLTNYEEQKNKYPQLEFFHFFNGNFSFPVNMQQTEFLQDVNTELITMKNNLLMQKICKKYYSNPFFCRLT